MSRQNSPLVLIGDGSSRELPQISLGANNSAGGYSEAWLQNLVFEHPQLLPISEIDPSYVPAVPICRELDTRAAGYIDALYLNHLGMPTLVECKLWRNPEARREVVGQILDYARALKRWSYTDLQREAAIARKEQGFDVVEHVRNRLKQDVEEATFVDNVTRNLQKGRILLLILGDGIREGVEAIAEYVQSATSLQFTLGLVEAKIFDLGEERRIVQSRVLAKTVIVKRTVVDVVAPGLEVSDASDEAEATAVRPNQPDERQKWMHGFWSELINGLRLDDREQPTARATFDSKIFFVLPMRGDMWITCYFQSAKNIAGVFLGYWRTSEPANEVIRRLEADRDEIDAEFENLGLQLTWSRLSSGKTEIKCSTQFADIRDERSRVEELQWFSRTINSFVNAFRPRVIEAMQDIAASNGDNARL